MDTLPPLERAVFSTAVRLLSCTVTESLTRAIYIPVAPFGLNARALAVVLSSDASNKSPAAISTYKLEDILAVVPLKHVPIFKHDTSNPYAPEIGLLDPMDTSANIFVVDCDGANGGKTVIDSGTSLTAQILRNLSNSGWDLPPSAALRPLTNPIDIWDKYARDLGLDDALRKEVADELASAVRWQTYSYQNPPHTPSLDDSSVVWEQSIVEGHPTHPMHKSRMFLPPIPNYAPGDYDLYNPQIRFVAVPAQDLHITGDFTSLVAPLVDYTAKKAGRKPDVSADRVLVPIHELQVHQILDKFPDVQVLPSEFVLPARAQQSIRSLIVPHALTTTSLKLGVGIKLTSAVRTISPPSAFLGPRFSSQVVPALHMDRSILTVAKELASVVHKHSDGEIAKHCTAIVRECYELGSEERGERLIVCTSLVERGHIGTDPEEPVVVRAFGLDTEEKRCEWLESFVRIFLAAFLPPMLIDGVGFEAHPQNTLVRFSLNTKPPRILGFVIRDFGGIRVHPETLRESTGIEPASYAMPGHSIIANTIEDVYVRMYHTVFHNHFQQLIRVLGLHYSGKGWNIVRKCLHEQIPTGHPLERAWLGEGARKVLGKCYMRMRIAGAYRFHMHEPFPNLLHYTSEEIEGRRIECSKSNQ